MVPSDEGLLRRVVGCIRDVLDDEHDIGVRVMKYEDTHLFAFALFDEFGATSLLTKYGSPQDIVAEIENVARSRWPRAYRSIAALTPRRMYASSYESAYESLNRVFRQMVRAYDTPAPIVHHQEISIDRHPDRGPLGMMYAWEGRQRNRAGINDE